MTLTILSLWLLSFGSVHANPLSRDTGGVSLTVSAKVNTPGTNTIVEQDQVRVQSLWSEQGQTIVSDGIFIYTTEVGVGTPPTYHSLLVDIGSSNTWIGATQKYVPTSSSVETGNTVGVKYGGASFSGEEWLDTVTITPNLVIKHQSIGVATITQGIDGFDGILGLGPVDTTKDTVSNTFEVPTVLDNLYSQGDISQEVLGIFLPPIDTRANGQLTFGGYDELLTTSAMNYVPLTKTSNASLFWGIDQSLSYGDTAIMSSAPGVVDTGTTLIYIPSDAYERYVTLTGAIYDPVTDLLAITCAQYHELQTLSFNIGGTSYDLTPDAQIWPRSLNQAMGGNSSAIYLIVGNATALGGNYSFINGNCFLQRFYSVYDTTHQCVGFAETTYTKSELNFTPCK